MARWLVSRWKKTADPNVVAYDAGWTAVEAGEWLGKDAKCMASADPIWERMQHRRFGVWARRSMVRCGVTCGRVSRG